MRSGSGSLRTDSPGCFYPIFITKDMKHFAGAGNALPIGVDRGSVNAPDGTMAIFPIHEDGTEGRWQYSRDKYLEIQKAGFVRISTQTSRGITLRYISEGWQKKVANGQIKIAGKSEDGSLIFNDEEYVQEYIPCNQWWISTTIQRETKLFLGADNEETAELTVPMYDFGDWASRMKAYRKKNHITQQELAQLMGVKHFTLRSWEQKQAKPPYNVWRLHKHLFDDSIKLT